MKNTTQKRKIEIIVLAFILVAAMTLLSACGDNAKADKTKTDGDVLQGTEYQGEDAAIGTNGETDNKTASNNKKANQKKEAFPSGSGRELSDMETDVDLHTTFADYDLTMINIWGTWCSWCVKEMPDIQAVYAGKADNINVITICEDADQNLEACLEILESVGAEFKTYAPNNDLYKNLIRNIKGFPTTLFVDSEGNLVGEPAVGARDAKKYNEEIAKRSEE